MKTLFRLLIYLRFVSFKRLVSLYSMKADHIVVVFPNKWNQFLNYFRGALQNDLCTLRALLDKGLEVRIVFGPNFGKFHNKSIYLSAGAETNLYGFDNHASPLHFWTKQLEEQGNKCFLSHQESLYWENKIYMHQQFSSLDIPCPKTFLMSVSELQEKGAPFPFPFIIKWPHAAGSAGLYSISRPEDLTAFLKVYNEKTHSMIIIQERLNMRRDLRVICAGNQIVWHYWRINLGKDWKPTSTGHGSKVDFENFPEQWRSWILEQFAKLNLRCGAFDVAWQDDDLNASPLILEVSPSFSPNPKPVDSSWLPRYGEYKKKNLWKDSYIERHILLQYEIRKKALA